MATTSSSPDRIATLDIVRGVAVMGILAMNIVAFAMPVGAYMNPMAYGSETSLDLAAYAFNFILIDGKMRGLFSFLFGASMLLVIEKAEAKGLNSASVHYRRMLVLLLFGAMHFYLIWFGDILFGYALIGMVAWFFRNMAPRKLIALGATLIFLQFLIMASFAYSAQGLSVAASQPGASADTVAAWKEMSLWVRVPSSVELAEQMGRALGPWTSLVHYQLTEHRWEPLIFSLTFGPETLGYMLFGMAALKSGFFAGSWDEQSYTRVAVRGFLIGIPIYLVIVSLIFLDGFSPVGLFWLAMVATVLVRPIMIVAVAALIIILTDQGGWLVERIAAAGRAAFTNYLGTSILMTGLFYGWGLGLFGELSRAELWLVVIAAWVVMLAWSKPWLERFEYGPLEWLWRSLSRGSLQPMRKPALPAVV
ncbi:DUF418 domain-containing protein [Sphingomonas sp. NSE70-1]|uniref:DUF418 domain-containing protein n=1 Tax=Sphingomonas caseinilyticus TaxID=2908205 RepID=A0ABT0RWE0_9SPHN|nr:DUF418 domain-containing protein [Sphingomonas caseinilyticus]MCL6699348.1 DUF418 domain-containing protein [Sphingomonas caseinilyticus]